MKYESRVQEEILKIKFDILMVSFYVVDIYWNQNICIFTFLFIYLSVSIVSGWSFKVTYVAFEKM